jgi:hypothetical protein
MPVKRRVAKIRRQDLLVLDREQERTLLHGRGFFREPAFADEESFAAAWEIHRDRLLPEWIAAHPGTRPAAWWKREHHIPHPPFIDPADEGHCSPRALFVRHGEIVSSTEDEADYLNRIGLLTPEEVAALEAEDEK